MRALVLAAFLLALAPTATALVEGTSHFSPPAVAELEGPITMDSGAFVGLYATHDGAALSLRIAGDDLELTLRTMTEEFVAAGPNNWGPVPGSAQSNEEDLTVGQGRIEVDRGGPNLTAVFRFEGQGVADANGLRLEAPLEDVYLSTPGWIAGPSTLEPFRPNDADWPNRHTWMAEGRRHHLGANELTVDHEGLVEFSISGADAVVVNASGARPIHTGSWREVAPDDPTGLSAGTRMRWHHAVLIGRAHATLHASYAGPYGHLVPSRASLADVTLLSVPLANASLDFGGKNWSSQNESFLDLRGRFQMGLDEPDSEALAASRIAARLEGDIVSIAENRGIPVRFDPVVGVAATAAVLATLLAFLTAAGRELLAFITGRNVASPLAHPVRVRLLDEIARRPGITQMQLATAAGIDRWLARYHLSILRRSHLIDVVRSGTADSFLLNSGSYRSYLPPAADAAPARAGEKVLAATALALLNHPVRRRICDALVRRGAATYAIMVDAWNELGLPAPHPTPRNVTHHAALLHRAGVLQRRRDGPRVFWSLAVDVDSLMRARRDACLTDPDAASVHAALTRQRGLTVRQLLSEISPNDSSKALEARIRAALLRMQRWGLLVRDPERDAYLLMPAPGEAKAPA